MGDNSQAVFLSYASQDAEAVKRICEALRAAGLEVWFDQEDLVGGDAWDQKIRGQIKACALFIPVISASSNARREGYFRREWKLAVDRTHDMDEALPFLFPVVIDFTTDAAAFVPEKFREVQWTWLPDGQATPQFVAHITQLLQRDLTSAPRSNAPDSESEVQHRGFRAVNSRPAKHRVPAWPWGVAAIVALPLAYLLFKPRRSPEEVSRLVASAMAAAQNAESKTAVAVAPTTAVPSKARQLALRANAMTSLKYNSNAADFAAAESLLKEALELDPNDAEVWAYSSLFNNAMRTRGYDPAPARREAARSQAERALKLDPDSLEALYALGRWQRDNDPDPTVREATLLKVVQRDPNHSGALFSLGTLYQREDRIEESMAMFERAARQPGGLPLARYGEYLGYFARSRFAEAERCLQESIAAEPSGNSVTGLAMVLLTSRGDTAGATKILDEVPAGNRNEHRVVWMTAFAQLAARQPEEALASLRRLSADYIQDNWFTGPTAYWTGRAHLQAGRLAAARIAFESALQLQEARLKAAPENFELHVTRGELLAWLGRSDEAVREAQTAMELTPRTYQVPWFVSTVRIYAVLGRADDAIPMLEKLCERSEKSIQWPLTPALLRIDPLWDKLRNDPRFAALARVAP